MPADTPGSPDFSITNVQPSSGNVTTLPTTTVTAKRDPVPAKALWMRMWDVVIARPGGDDASDMNVQSLSQFHFQFEIDLSCNSNIQKAMVMIYNPPPELVTNNLAQWNDITITGGYQNARYGELFSGQITYFKYGKNSPLETYLQIHAAMDAPYTQAVVNHALPAGTTGNDIINAVLTALTPFGITRGQITALAAQMPKSPRGRTLFGMPMDILRDLSQTLDARVFIDNNQLHMLGPGEQLSGDEIELNTGNGLINFPEQEMNGGVRVQCLLHYQIRPGRVIHVNEKDFNKITKAQGGNLLVDLGLSISDNAIQPDGKYGVFSVKHHGDNRGQTWYTDIVTNPIIPQAPTLNTGA